MSALLLNEADSFDVELLWQAIILSGVTYLIHDGPEPHRYSYMLEWEETTG